MRKFATIAFLAMGLFVWTGCPEQGKTTTPPAAGDKPAGDKPAGDKPAGDKPAGDKPAENKGSEVKIFWKDAGVGSVVEMKTLTDMTKPMAMKTESSMKQTLKAKDDKGYTLSTEMTAGGQTMPASETTVEWPKTGGEAGKTDAKNKKIGDEDVKVGDKTYKCEHWQTESETAGVKSVIDSWTHEGLAIKSVMKNDNMTSTTEVTKIEKK